MTLDVASVDAIARRLAELLGARPTPPQPLLSAEQLATALGVSRDRITRITRAGCPVVRIEHATRYDLDKVKAWLETRPTPARVAADNEPLPVRLGKGGR